MVYKGHIEHGSIVLDEPADLPEGAEVTVDIDDKTPIPTLYERLKDIIGVIDDMPEDMAQQHDHYIHGTPKR
jgi:hypothetical protein